MFGTSWSTIFGIEQSNEVNRKYGLWCALSSVFRPRLSQPADDKIIQGGEGQSADKANNSPRGVAPGVAIVRLGHRKQGKAYQETRGMPQHSNQRQKTDIAGSAVALTGDEAIECAFAESAENEREPEI